MTGVKVGDVVAWDKVPSGALVRLTTGHGEAGHAMRINDLGKVVNESGRWRDSQDPVWRWSAAARPDESVTIVTMGLTGRETAAELQRLAEVYEVREALQKQPWAQIEVMFFVGLADGQIAWHTMAEYYHAAGWRPGMTAEDAARLLAEVRDG